MGDTKIDWATKSWNVTAGCEKVSPGCKNCFAERMAARLKSMGQADYRDVVTEERHWKRNVIPLPHRLEEPLSWRKPQRIFVNSMSDLFHRDVPVSFIVQVFAIMRLAEQHTFMILTKRPGRMQDYLAAPDFWEEVTNRVDWFAENGPVAKSPLPNLLLGVSVEDRTTADERIPLLLQTPAAVRFVSYEPALGRVDFEPWLSGIAETGKSEEEQENRKIHLVIMGCESGPGARPMDLDWARSVRDQCQAAGVPFFFKQAIAGKLIHMPELDGRKWAEFPE